jgi:Cu+-exporting ATPase
MEKDPVCGMGVDRDTAAAAWKHEGVVYRFCSVGCMERFRADPDHYLSLDDADRTM